MTHTPPRATALPSTATLPAHATFAPSLPADHAFYHHHAPVAAATPYTQCFRPPLHTLPYPATACLPRLPPPAAHSALYTPWPVLCLPSAIAVFTCHPTGCLPDPPLLTPCLQNARTFRTTPMDRLRVERYRRRARAAYAYSSPPKFFQFYLRFSVVPGRRGSPHRLPPFCCDSPGTATYYTWPRLHYPRCHTATPCPTYGGLPTFTHSLPLPDVPLPSHALHTPLLPYRARTTPRCTTHPHRTACVFAPVARLRTRVYGRFVITCFTRRTHYDQFGSLV